MNPPVFDGQITLRKSEWTYDQGSPHFGPGGVKGAMAKSLGYMRKLKQLLDAHNIPMTVVVYPWPGQLAYDTPHHYGVRLWEDFCREYQCAGFIDANPAFFALRDSIGLDKTVEQLYLPNDVHFSRGGNKIIFDHLERSLTSKQTPAPQ